MSHILFVNHTRALHGSEQILIQSIIKAHEAGHRITVVLPSYAPDCGLENTIKPFVNNILLLPYRTVGGSWLRTQLVALYNTYARHKLIHYILQQSVQHIYSSTYVTTIGIEAAIFTKTHHLWHIHEMPNQQFEWRPSFGSYYRKLMNYKHNKIIFIANGQLTQWQQALSLNLSAEIIYNPIRLIPIDSIKHCGIRIGYIGAFAERKNIKTLISAFEQINQLFPETELWLCGAVNEHEKQIIKQQTSLPEKCLHISDAISHAEAFYAQIDILVLPSLAETMPLVVLEAIQAGVCVIQTTHSCMDELFKDKEETLFFEPQDVSLLVSHLRNCMTDTYRRTISDRAKQRLQELNFNATFDKKIKSLFNND